MTRWMLKCSEWLLVCHYADTTVFWVVAMMFWMVACYPWEWAIAMQALCFTLFKSQWIKSSGVNDASPAWNHDPLHYLNIYNPRMVPQNPLNLPWISVRSIGSQQPQTSSITVDRHRDLKARFRLSVKTRKLPKSSSQWAPELQLVTPFKSCFSADSVMSGSLFHFHFFLSSVSSFPNTRGGISLIS